MPRPRAYVRKTKGIAVGVVKKNKTHTASRLSLPVRWAEPAVEPHPVGHPLDQPARTRPERVPLVAVHHLVGEHARDLGCQARGGADGVDVAEGEVDFFVVVVEGCLLFSCGRGGVR